MFNIQTNYGNLEVDFYSDEIVLTNKGKVIILTNDEALNLCSNILEALKLRSQTEPLNTHDAGGEA